MSGGVDSSVSAALLKRAGYEVVGAFIKVWEPEGFPCTWREDRRDAMRVAAQLDIPLVTVDLSREYERDVVRYMISEYAAGRTPNPDVECNRAVKFGAFFHWAMRHGADYVATGHYARVRDGVLMRGVDANKDQSYFLWALTRKELNKTIFPVGEYEKSEVRKLAKRFGLATAEKKDSQGLCFLGRLDTKKFLSRYLQTKVGKVVDEQGKVLGTHQGVWFYTLGEHHYGYIIKKDLKKNILIVSENLPRLGKNVVVALTDVNWNQSQVPDLNKFYQARIRHRGELKKCKLEKKGKNWQVIFPVPPEAIAPGQSLVIYDQEICLGGGIIK